MRNQKIHTGKFERYIRRTFKNKLCAIVLLGIGALATIPDGDATFFVLILFITIPLFFTKENWIDWVSDGSFFLFYF